MGEIKIKTLLRNIGALILGIIIGSIINMGLIICGGNIFPFPENFNSMDALNWDIKYFLFPFLAHSMGTFSGAFIASKISKKNDQSVAIAVGVYFLSGGIYMVTILPAPIWFICLDLILCYLPMALLGWYLNRRIGN